jgi:hypothetical protein
VFDGDLLPVLSEKDSFDGLFDRKGGEVSEGLACFWRTTKFRKLHTTRIILSESLQSEPRFESMWKIVQSNENLNKSMLARTTAVQIVVLESLTKADHGLIIGITHLYFKPEADHIRLLQTALCLGHLENTLKFMKESNPKMQFSVILAGDFNSTPPFGVLQFLREGTINDAHPDWLSCKEEQVVEVSKYKNRTWKCPTCTDKAKRIFQGAKGRFVRKSEFNGKSFGHFSQKKSRMLEFNQKEDKLKYQVPDKTKIKHKVVCNRRIWSASGLKYKCVIPIISP